MNRAQGFVLDTQNMHGQLAAGEMEGRRCWPGAVYSFLTCHASETIRWKYDLLVCDSPQDVFLMPLRFILSLKPDYLDMRQMSSSP